MRKFLASLLVLGLLLPTSIVQAGYYTGNVQFHSFGGPVAPWSAFDAGIITFSAPDKDIIVKRMVIHLYGSTNPYIFSSLSLVAPNIPETFATYSAKDKGFLFTFDHFAIQKGNTVTMNLSAVFSDPSQVIDVSFAFRSLSDVSAVDAVTGEPVTLSLCGKTYCSGQKITLPAGNLNVAKKDLPYILFTYIGSQLGMQFSVKANPYENMSVKKMTLSFKTNLPSSSFTSSPAILKMNTVPVAAFIMPPLQKDVAQSVDIVLDGLVTIPGGAEFTFDVEPYILVPETPMSERAYFMTSVTSVLGTGKTSGVAVTATGAPVSNLIHQ